MVNIFENAQKVAVLDKKCEGCESSLVEVNYKVRNKLQVQLILEESQII